MGQAMKWLRNWFDLRKETGNSTFSDLHRKKKRWSFDRPRRDRDCAHHVGHFLECARGRQVSGNVDGAIFKKMAIQKIELPALS